MASRTITVLGATGTQGASVVDTFAETGQWHIRAVTRNSSSVKANELTARHPAVEVVEANTNDLDSLRRAFAGSHVIFAVTDYWAPFKDPALREQHATGANPADSLRRWAFDEEVKQGKNIADAAAHVLSTEGKLERFIWSSLPSTKKYSNGKYSHVYHFDSKSVVDEYIQDTCPVLAQRTSVLYVGFYVSNMLESEMMRPIKLRDGTYLVQRLCPEDAKHPFMLTRADTGVMALALINKPEITLGKRLLGYTAMLSWGELAQLWGQALNVQVQFREVSVDQFKKRFPVDGEELLSATYSAEFGFAGRDPEVLVPADLGIQERPQEVEKWLSEQDWTRVLDAAPDEDL